VGRHLDWWQERSLGLTIAEIIPDEVAEARDALMAQTSTRGEERTIKGEQVSPMQYRRTGATIRFNHRLTLLVRGSDHPHADHQTPRSLSI
jgi:hypothetical protein